ncbi:MAG: carboxypeptidase-like regulatory domain-containing protein, partial [Acidobacteriota bacterium]
MTRRIRRGLVAFAVAAMCSAPIAEVRAQRGAEGTGEISGSVVTTGTGARPLARVLVTMSGTALKSSRTVITDDLGRFAFRNLPTGRFTLVASRPPYVKTSYGAKRPGRPGTPIDLAAGQRLADITIPLARGAAITGFVRSQSGEPMPGVAVGVMPLDAQLD